MRAGAGRWWTPLLALDARGEGRIDLGASRLPSRHRGLGLVHVEVVVPPTCPLAVHTQKRGR